MGIGPAVSPDLRNLNSGGRALKVFWEGEVPFTLCSCKGVNDKKGLVGPKVRFKFRKQVVRHRTGRAYALRTA